MKNSSIARVNVAFLLAILLTSAITMLWLLWRFPISTSVAAAAVLVCLGISANLSSADTEGRTDLDSGETGIQPN